MKSIIIAFACVLPAVGLAQRNRLKHANALHHQMAYSAAAEAYLDAIDRGASQPNVSVKLADCYYKMNKNSEAHHWYGVAEDNGKLTQNEYEHYILAAREIGDTANATRLSKAYEMQFGATPLTHDVLKNKDRIEALKKSSRLFKINEEVLSTPHSEVSAGMLDNEHIFVMSAKRRVKAIKRINNWTGGYFYDLYLFPSMDNGKKRKMKALKGAINGKFNVGPVSYDKKNNRIYFTRDEVSRKAGLHVLKLYVGNMKGRKVTDVKELPVNSTDNSFSCAHPSLSKDGDYLYFVSNKPGGFGGFDIYKVPVNNGSFGKAMNLGSGINTPYEEVFPFVSPKNGDLYFASNGHLSLGGLDVLMAPNNQEGGFKTPENLGAPINSQHDDFALQLSDDEKSGFFSTDRTTDQLDNIWSFTKREIRSVTLDGNLLTDDNDPINGVTVVAKDKAGNVIAEAVTDEEGNYQLPLVNDEFYTLEFNSDKIDDIEPVSIKTNVPGDVITRTDRGNTKYVDIAGLVTDAKTGEEMEGVEVLIVDQFTGEKITQTTGNDGVFGEPLKGLHPGDEYHYKVFMEKAGYVTKVIHFKGTVGSYSTLNIPTHKTGLAMIERGVEISEDLNIQPILWEYNSAFLTKQAKEELDKLISFLNNSPSVKVEMGSHTDARGTETSNRILSNRRAGSAARYVKERISDPWRVTSKGYGESQLKIDCVECSEADHQTNRRTEFVIQ